MVWTAEPPTGDAILSVRDLQVHFNTRNGVGKAVDGVTFDLRRGETLGLVGESGSGKSLTALSILGLNPKPASHVVGGEVLFGGENLLDLSERALRKIRGGRISLVLQDPLAALNPVLSVGHQMREPLRIHRKMRGRAARRRSVELLELLRVPGASGRLKDYPHQLSGGMRQRVVGAIALAGEPEVLIADEPTTSLDVIVQAAYLALLRRIQRERDLSILFITHDFGVVSQMCDRVAVMYAGRIVEIGPVADIAKAPVHPYTRGLVRSVPDVRVKPMRLEAITGSSASMFSLPEGCRFADRCPHAVERCLAEYPAEERVGSTHSVSCWRWRELRQ